ncbi:DUF3168 domain-containing protein [Caulobacter sp. NIBR2454]|uniref:DUF3168 domain-containing protein n=1 Tax=Caulobacter sp. NIBR2454 TaxID=3015996 RepID=UPI0022B65606|nr:DUF3168 domain-containing protein [Caulobacter sp. NIBR2454]
MDAERALQGALITLLREAPGLQPLLGDPVRVFDATPEKPTYPYLALGRSQVRALPEYGGGVDDGLEHSLTLTCVSRFDGTEEAKAITAALRAVLHGASPAMEGWRVVNLTTTFADVFRAADRRSVFGVLRVRVVTEAAE